MKMPPGNGPIEARRAALTIPHRGIAVRAITFAVSAALAALTMTACDSGDSTACRDFTTWYHGTGGDLSSGKNDALLQKAVNEAAGSLQEQLSTLQSLVQSAVQDRKEEPNGQIAQIMEDLAKGYAPFVVHACQS